jgi:hypothetical protein
LKIACKKIKFSKPVGGGGGGGGGEEEEEEDL